MIPSKAIIDFIHNVVDGHNIAVISLPRTGSKSLVNICANLTNKKIAYGILHKPDFLGKQWSLNEVEDIVFSENYILHGHWHTIELLPDSIQTFVKTRYKILTIDRDPNYIKNSIKNLVKNKLSIDVDDFILENKISHIFDVSFGIRDQWPVHHFFEFEKLYHKL